MLAGDPGLGLAQRALKTNLLLALAPRSSWLSLFYGKQQQRVSSLSSLRAAGEREGSASKVLWKELLGAIRQEGWDKGWGSERGYTLEMPKGVFLVRLCSRNLEMLKRVSGRWKLNGSSCSEKS